VRTLAFPYPFHQTPWPDLASKFDDLAERNRDFQPMADIVHSVIDSGSADLLAAFTSMHDLCVVATPIPDPPMDLVVVRTTAHGSVLIEHQTGPGNNDRIERPGSDAVPLFWRFMIEKFGVPPTTPPQSSRTSQS
jgi:hypothetical protein